MIDAARRSQVRQNAEKFLQQIADEAETVALTHEHYQPYWAARGHLLQLLNQKDEAQKSFSRAASLTDDPALRKYLSKRSAGTFEMYKHNKKSLPHLCRSGEAPIPLKIRADNQWRER